MQAKKKECLIIDDDQDDQEIFLMCLRKVSKDIECKAINDGVEAISLLSINETYVPDYIFLDVNMPKMNGIDCLRILKNMPRLQYTRIFMYSTTSQGAALAQSKELGAEDFIVKPSKTTELKDKLSSIFKIVSEINTPNTPRS